MWKLSIADDQANRTVVNLAREEYTIGRAEECSVRLTERNISRTHARLMRNGTGWVLEDLDSYNGCYVNGSRVSGTQRLDHGDLVQLGDYRLELLDDAVVQPGDPKATVPSVPKSQSLLGQPDRLVMLVGPTPGAEFPLSGQSLTLGRGEECDIQLNHSSVSRVHAEIHTAGPGRYEIVDRGSANGVRINGLDLERGLVDARDNIELGDVVLKFIPAGVIYKPDAGESQQIDALTSGPVERMTPAPVVDIDPRMKPSVPPAIKAVGALLGLGILVLLGMLIVGGGGKGDAAGPAATAEAASDKSARTLEEATRLLEAGKVQEAHELVVGGIAADSNARQSAAFREIEARWADMLFDQAAAEPDLIKKRAILDRIAKATSVDSARRKRAGTEIDKLDADGVAVDELPDAVPSVKPPDGAKVQDGIVRENPFGNDAPAPGAAPGPKAPAPKPKSISELAMSGDRAQMEQAKGMLLAQGPNASSSSLRMLRGLCAQLGDQSCVNQAQGWLAAKAENP